jgi:hypothetical protein
VRVDHLSKFRWQLGNPLLPWRWSRRLLSPGTSRQFLRISKRHACGFVVDFTSSLEEHAGNIRKARFPRSQDSPPQQPNGASFAPPTTCSRSGGNQLRPDGVQPSRTNETPALGTIYVTAG